MKRQRFDKDIKPSEVTDRDRYLDRRQFMKAAAALAGRAVMAVALPGVALTATANPSREVDGRQSSGSRGSGAFAGVPASSYSTREDPSTWYQATNYNNFYEFGAGKQDPARHSPGFSAWPTRLTIGGYVDNPATIEIEDLIRRYPPEERIYRLRCVEAWSMVVPWVGFPLASLIADVQPTSRARYVAFTSFFQADLFPDRSLFLAYPYVEGLRMDEAMNELTLLAVGMYGDTLSNTNGPRIRLVVPWKYGFKSIKSIDRIDFTEVQPRSTWSGYKPQEYGFYSNVNPVRGTSGWSQQTETRIGESGRRRTQPFNGYGRYVSHLYQGMDLISNDY